MKKLYWFTPFIIVGLIVYLNLLSSGGMSATGKSQLDKDDAKTHEPIGELFQVILNVHDMKLQVEFYRDIMGFPVVYPDSIKDLSKESFVRLNTGGAALVMHSGRNVKVGKQEPRISFMTQDVNLTRVALIKKGVKLSQVRSPAPGVLVVDGRDPEGNAFHIESRVPPQK